MSRYEVVDMGNWQYCRTFLLSWSAVRYAKHIAMSTGHHMVVRPIGEKQKRIAEYRGTRLND